MYVAKIEGKSVRVVDAKTGGTKRTFSCAGYKGATAVDVSGDLVSVTCGDGKVRVWDIKTGGLKRVI
jgi:WD40 repeat protein